MPGGRPERLAAGEEDRRAQSKGECPGSSSTFLRDFDAGAFGVGGGPSELEGPRFGNGEGRTGGGINEEAVGVNRAGPRAGPDARCAEFAAGKTGKGTMLSDMAKREGPEARCAELTAGKDGGGMLSLKEKLGMLGVLEGRLARGVVGAADFLNVGGGGIDVRSRASIFLFSSASTIVAGGGSCLGGAFVFWIGRADER